MKISDFELYRDLLQRNSGLALGPDKSYLLDSRLTPISRTFGYPTMEAMTLALRGIPELTLVEAVVEAMANTETSFFRDRAVIEAIAGILVPHLLKEGGKAKKTLRIWSAGCSTGQEPFSIALELKARQDDFPDARIEILATDLSGEALRRARAATFSQFDVQRGLPVQYLLKNFDEVGDNWRLHDDLQAMVRFDSFNLLEPMDELGLFDIILCRNVLEGFASEMRATVLNRLGEQLAPNGFLVLGQSETIREQSPFRPLKELQGIHILNDGDYDMTRIEQAFIKHALKTSVSAVNARRARKDA